MPGTLWLLMNETVAEQGERKLTLHKLLGLGMVLIV